MDIADQLTLTAGIFKAQGFRIEENEQTIAISRNRYGKIFVFLLFEIVALILLITGISYSINSTLILSAFILGPLPMLFDRIAWPYFIIIDKINKTVKLKHGVSYSQEIRFVDISGLLVDEHVLDSDTSPFKEGYQDFEYAFYLMSVNRKIKLIRFSFREENAAQMQLVFNYLRPSFAL